MNSMLCSWLVVLGTATGAGGAPASRMPEPADLVFTSRRDGNSEIYLLRAGEREWINLTNHEGRDNWPVWSPDGTRILFQSDRSGNLDVWVMAADGSEPRRLTTDPEPDYLPAWAPDGRTISFTSWRREEGDAERAPHIYLMNADGTGQRRLVKESLGTSAGASWSPDGRRLVFSRSSGGKGADLFLADRDGSNERRLTTDEERNLYNGSPVFSPDGESIAFYSSLDSVSALVVIRADGTGRRTVLGAGKSWYPRWSARGDWLVFTAAVKGGDKDDYDIFGIPATGDGTPVLLVGGKGREVEGSWRPVAGRAHDRGPLPPPTGPPPDGSPAPGRRPEFGQYIYVEELPEALTKVQPVYPDEARRAGIEGTVLVQALVLEDGAVGDTRIVQSVPGLDEAAVESVRRWRFKPAMTAGRPVVVWVGVPVRFRLR